MKLSSRAEWFDDFFAGFTAYYLTSLPVLLGVLFGANFPLRSTGRSPFRGADPYSSCFRNDAVHYLRIAREGYSYDPSKKSLVAFFPAYPLLSRWLGKFTGMSPEESVLLTAQIALRCAFVLLARYVRLRWTESTAGQRGLVLAIFGLWPLGIFFRMPYAESLFLCVTLVMLCGLVREWPLTALAFMAGLGTAVRPVGVALTATFIWHVLTRFGLSARAKAQRILLMTPLACWGLVA